MQPSFSSSQAVVSAPEDRAPEILRLNIAPSRQAAHYARLDVANFLSTNFLNTECVEEFMLAVGEAIANAVEHGKSHTSIIVTADVESGWVSVSICDKGSGFEKRANRSASLPPTESEHGRGLSIMTYCTDSFLIDSRPGEGTCVFLTRRLSTADMHTQVF